MQNVKTKIWVDGNKENTVTVDREVTDLDEVSKMLGYPGYDALCFLNDVDEKSLPLRFQHVSHE